MIIAIISFLILLVALVTIHEFGHFILARKSGVTVHEFAVGMGPKIWSFGTDKKGTEYTIRLLPLGGFVNIKGESPQEEGAITAKDSFIRVGFWKKIAILLGGIAMNILGAWVLFTIGFLHGIKPIQVLPDNIMAKESESYLMPSYSFLKRQGFISGEASSPALVGGVAVGGLADSLGLSSGDVIQTINGVPVTSLTIQNELAKYIGKNIEIGYNRNEENMTGVVTCPYDSCLLGVVLDTKSDLSILPIRFNLLQAMGKGAHEVQAQTQLTFRGLANIIIGAGKGQGGESLNKLSGPIGAAKIGQFILERDGFLQFLMFGGLISMALAIFNLLPIPALDGGRVLGVIIQKVFRLKEEKYYAVESWINMVFFIALLGLGFYIMAHDLVKAWGVNIPFIG